MADNSIPVTYLLSPTTALNWFPPASRILTETLMQCTDLQVHFSRAPIELFLDSFIDYRWRFRQLKNKTGIDSYMEIPFRVVPHLDVMTGRFDDELIKGVPTDIVLLSALSVFDLPVVKMLLERGKRVVLGGNLTMLYGPARLRALLCDIGVDASRLERDLMIITGFAYPGVDLASMIRAWRDVEIAGRDFSPIFRCTHDHLIEHAPSLKKALGRVSVALPLSTGCWYGKCQFCSVRNQPTYDFSASLGPDAIITHIHELAKLYGTDSFVLTDNYLQLTQNTRTVLAARKNLHFTVYSGIKLLTNAKHVQDLNKYVDGLRIGVESASDFALGQVGKGYNHADILTAVNNLIAHFDKDKELTLLIVFDLPHEDADDVHRSFNRLVEIKQRLVNAGFKYVLVVGFPLITFPNTELFTTSPLLEIRPLAELADAELCGLWNLHRWYERTLHRPMPGFVEKLVAPFRRRDAHGNILPCDLSLLDPKQVKYLQGRLTAGAVVEFS